MRIMPVSVAIHPTQGFDVLVLNGKYSILHTAFGYQVTSFFAASSRYGMLALSRKLGNNTNAYFR
jgi:1,4-alpha-glucan branching enzyme